MKVYIFLKKKQLQWQNNYVKNFVGFKMYIIFTFKGVGWQTHKDL